MPLPFEPRRDLMHLFSTPVGTLNVPDAADLTPKIAEVILAKEASEQGLTRSNQGGWHSKDDLMTWPELAFANLPEMFQSSVSHMIAATSRMPRFNVQLKMAAWANVNRPGTANSTHIHPENHWSGVFYVQTTDFSADPLEKAGNLILRDPRGPVSMLRSPGQTDVFAIAPRQGTIVMFPSWLYHSVRPFSIDTVRISIAFNARIEKIEAAG